VYDLSQRQSHPEKEFFSVAPENEKWAVEEISLKDRLVEFCRFVRDNGFAAGMPEVLTTLRAARSVSIEDRSILKFALRAVLCSSKDQWDRFDLLFQAFWDECEIPRIASNTRPADENFREHAKGAVMLMGEAHTQAQEEGKAVSGANAREKLTRTDFAEVPSSDMAELEKLSLRLLRQMSQRLYRRLESMKVRGKIDLRKTIRGSIGNGGEPLNRYYRAKKVRPHRLLIFLDVSGSMNAYSLFLVRFAYALQKHFRRMDTFLFSTNITEITPILRSRGIAEVLRALSGHATGWSGGTKIGESLRDFNARYGRRLLSSDTLFMVLSDGWDTGEPEVLATELGEIRRRVGKLIWLNPLLGMDDYQPVTAGMSAALPHIDVFAPAHNLESLLQLEAHMVGGRRRPMSFLPA